MPDINYSKIPVTIEAVSGNVIVTLYDADEEAQKFYVDVNVLVDPGVSVETVSHRLTQDRNAAGYAHFDISPILRNNVDPDDTLVSTSLLKNADNEQCMYRLNYGYIDINGTVHYAGTTGPLVLLQAINARKPYNQIDFPWEDYVFKYSASGSGASLFNVITADAVPLTDNTKTRLVATSLLNDLCYSLPTNFSGNLYYQERTIRRGEDLTLSYLTNCETLNSTAASYGADGRLGLRGFFFTFHSADGTQLYQYDLKNTLDNGGGPLNNSTSYYGIVNPAIGKYLAINVQVGASNSNIYDYINDPDVAFYTVVPYVDGFNSDLNVNTNDDCFVTATSVNARLAGDIQKFVIVDSDCNDFDHIQFAWTNSFGFMDYYTFTKRTDKRTDITRKNYTRLNQTWNDQTFSVPELSRGLTTFNIQAKDSGSATTDYLTKEENDYLRNMLVSPSVLAKIEGVWTPVVITDSQWVEKTFRKDRLFQLQVNYEIANQNNIQ